MAARSMDPLVDEKVDGYLIGQLTLLDRILSRKYSLPERHDGLPSTTDSERVKDKREGFCWRSEEPHPIAEQAEVKPMDDQLSIVSVRSTHMIVQRREGDSRVRPTNRSGR